MAVARLQKLLARSGAGSRRACEALIAEGRVTVNGAIATVGQSADPICDVICLDGVPIASPERVVLALNKPCGYMSAMHDPHGAQCVSELVPLDRWPSLFHVGRLDVDTSGLLLFTTDGELGNALAHPSGNVVKTYIARVKGAVTQAEADMLRRGVNLEDGITAPAEVVLTRVSPEESEVELKIHEGRNRQVRRMMDAVGHPVITLHRSAIGSVSVADVACGLWKQLSNAEIDALFAS